MARKFGKTREMSQHFYDYDYVINGVGGIGKTTMAYELGKRATGSNEGTFIITCGSEPEPKHIPGAFGDVAKTFDVFVEIVNELVDNKAEYPNTKFVAIDSLDEHFRMAEDYVVREWNSMCRKAGDLTNIAKSIAQAYKGFQKGESRVVDIVLKSINRLTDAGYRMLYLGHTKVKSKEDTITGVKYEQLTCNLDNKYYNAIKDKVNLVAMCYFENQIENIVEEKNPFNKKVEKKGDLVSKRRVMVFVDDDNAVDTKSHFEYIVNKTSFGADSLIAAVEDAVRAKLAAPDGEHKSPEHVELSARMAIVDEDKEDEKDGDFIPSFGTEYFVDARIPGEEEEEDPKERVAKIREVFSSADAATKREVKKIIVENGDGTTTKLSEDMPPEALSKIESLLGIA